MSTATVVNVYTPHPTEITYRGGDPIKFEPVKGGYGGVAGVDTDVADLLCQFNTEYSREPFRKPSAADSEPLNRRKRNVPPPVQNLGQEDGLNPDGRKNLVPQISKRDMLRKILDAQKIEVQKQMGIEAKKAAVTVLPDNSALPAVAPTQTAETEQSVTQNQAPLITPERVVTDISKLNQQQAVDIIADQMNLDVLEKMEALEKAKGTKRPAVLAAIKNQVAKITV